MFYTYCHISRKLDSKKITFHSQSRVYPLSFILNFRTGPGPVLSLFGLKDRRTGPFKKARTVDTLLAEHLKDGRIVGADCVIWGLPNFGNQRVAWHSLPVTELFRRSNGTRKARARKVPWFLDTREEGASRSFRLLMNPNGRHHGRTWKDTESYPHDKDKGERERERDTSGRHT